MQMLCLYANFYTARVDYSKFTCFVQFVEQFVLFRLNKYMVKYLVNAVHFIYLKSIFLSMTIY